MQVGQSYLWSFKGKSCEIKDFREKDGQNNKEAITKNKNQLKVYVRDQHKSPKKYESNGSDLLF